MTFLTVGVCDGCGLQGPARIDPHDAATAAKNDGWMIVETVAWCPSCRPARTERPGRRRDQEGETDEGSDW